MIVKNWILTFAGIARIAFIYTKLLNTLKKIFINDQILNFFMKTVQLSKKMQIGLNKIKEKGYKKKFCKNLAPKTLYIFNIK